jgi:hypothetical protein
MQPHSTRLAIAIVFAATLPFAQGTSLASSMDTKTQHPLTCQPRGPGTTAAELGFSVTGVGNPGATDETVVCPILVDSENYWEGDAGAAATVVVGYRPGSVPGRITCTAFVSTPDGSPVGTSTVVSPLRAANSGHSSIGIPVVLPAYDAFNISQAVLSVACLLGPKVTLVRVQLQERNQATFYEGP